MNKVAVVGASGYTGQELIRLLLSHSKVELAAVVSNSNPGKLISHIYPNFSRVTDLTCSDHSLEQLADMVDLIFLALPHGHAAAKVTDEILSKVLVIDLSADFRLKQAEEYPIWYHTDHPNPNLLSKAVYGLPELKREEIIGSRLVANPGCYATCSILSMAPLLMAGVIDPLSVVIDAKSGVSGAGRSLALGSHFDEVDESFKAYSVGNHRHIPEIEQELSACAGNSLRVTFTPHLVPMNRGILTTSYASANRSLTPADLTEIYDTAYGDECFVRFFDEKNPDYRFPETRWVKGSNFCDIGVTVDQRMNRVIVIGALDNLIKGAAGQAIQNMNILFGFKESTGLNNSPIFPG